MNLTDTVSIGILAAATCSVNSKLFGWSLRFRCYTFELVAMCRCDIAIWSGNTGGIDVRVSDWRQVNSGIASTVLGLLQVNSRLRCHVTCGKDCTRIAVTLKSFRMNILKLSLLVTLQYKSTSKANEVNLTISLHTLSLFYKKNLSLLEKCKNYLKQAEGCYICWS